MSANLQTELVSVKHWRANGPPRSEYLDGVVSLERTWHTLQMQATTNGHARCCFEIARALGAALDAARSRCRVQVEGPYVAVSSTRFRIPDVTVDCESDTRSDDHIVRPAVIVEVLSPATTHTDYNDKLAEYMALEYVTDYLVVDPVNHSITHYQREDGDVVTRQFTGSDQTIGLALGIALSLAFFEKL